MLARKLGLASWVALLRIIDETLSLVIAPQAGFGHYNVHHVLIAEVHGDCCGELKVSNVDASIHFLFAITNTIQE
mgnify:CR=1 FL=1